MNVQALDAFAAASLEELPPIPMRDTDHSEVLRCVAVAYAISPADLVGKRRSKAIGEARIVTYWLLRQLTQLSFPEIGRVLRKDHSSARSGVQRCCVWREENRKFQAFTDELERAVKARKT